MMVEKYQFLPLWSLLGHAGPNGMGMPPNWMNISEAGLNSIGLIALGEKKCTRETRFAVSGCPKGDLKLQFVAQYCVWHGQFMFILWKYEFCVQVTHQVANISRCCSVKIGSLLLIMHTKFYSNNITNVPNNGQKPLISPIFSGPEGGKIG